jgi:hypothetical protein
MIEERSSVGELPPGFKIPILADGFSYLFLVGTMKRAAKIMLWI